MKQDKNIKIATEIENNPLWKLILRYSLPAILSGLVGAFYNIIDQIFIGQSIGMIGNSATNVSFPLVTLTTAAALLFGIGGTANFSISLGQKEIGLAKKFVGAILVSIPVLGILITLITQLFTTEMLLLFGATNDNLPLALTYTKIVSLGFPLTMGVIAFGHLIRADGSPKYSMFSSIIGAVLNCIFNYLFMFVLDYGIAGAAWATVLGQFVSFFLVFIYFFRFKTFPITWNILKPDPKIIKIAAALGIAPAINQLSMTITQIVMNNSLTYYGALSSYGSDIPLACVGIISKVNMIYMTIMIGIAQGTQPLVGYNYGAKRYDKVRECYIKCIKYGSVFSIIAFIAFQIFPHQIISIFGSGSPEYYAFATLYFKTFMFMTFLNGLQPITGNFFTAIGKPIKGAIIAFTKQLMFLTPLIIILPMFWGIEGILYAGPIADVFAFTLSIVFVILEFRVLRSK